MATNRSRRLRKKLCVDEFQELGFEVTLTYRDGLENQAVDGFLELVKARGARLTVDFASGTPVSINAIVATMASTLGVEVTVRHEGAVAEYIEFRSADTTMRDRFGVAPKISFADGLKRLSAFLS